jgi:hypothetical protein
MKPEERARVLIDDLLLAAGWHICDMAQEVCKSESSPKSSAICPSFAKLKPTSNECRRFCILL